MNIPYIGSILVHYEYGVGVVNATDDGIEVYFQSGSRHTLDKKMVEAIRPRIFGYMLNESQRVSLLKQQLPDLEALQIKIETERLAEDKRQEELLRKAEAARLQEQAIQEVLCRQVEAERLREEASKEALSREIEAKRAELFIALQNTFKEDFLRADSFFESVCKKYISAEEYEKEKIFFIRNCVKNNNTELDNEQAAAVACVHGHIQVVARAGSGKTTTIVSRALFLHKHCGVAVGEMLLLAFNTKAANEMEERLEKLCGRSIPHVMTFHALARAIVQPTQEMIKNDSTEENLGLDNVFSDVIRDRLSDDCFMARVRTLMLAQFKIDWEAIVAGGFDLSPSELLRFRRNLARETLRGEYVKSHGEKVIANYLFEHGIPYSYEKVHYWKGQVYKPDFTLPSSSEHEKGIIIEYFGLADTDPEYDKQIKEKRKYWAAKNDKYELVELTPKDFIGGEKAFGAILRLNLETAGIKLNRLSEEEIWLNVKPRAIKRFSSAMSGFIGRCRKAWILPDKLKLMIAEHESIADVEDWFLELAVILYTDYLERLEANNQQDFDGLMQTAASIVELGKTTFERKNKPGNLATLRYIFIDEYQDFSELFHRLMQAIRFHNPEADFYCVGDDWQAINGFAGSNLTFFDNFKSYFLPSRQQYIATNYRSVSSVVTVGNALMSGRGKQAIAYNRSEGIVRIANLSNISLTLMEKEKYKNGTLTPAILRLANKALAEKKSVALLSRRKDLFIPSGGSITIDKYLDILRKEIPKEWRDQIIISTAHSFKGRQSDVVIVMDAYERSYPLIHPNWVFARILGESLQQIDDENRRLFYVALTRAKENLFIITENERISPYLDDIGKHVTIPQIDWDKYPAAAVSTDVLIVRISGSFFEFTDELGADGYIFDRYKEKPIRQKKYKKEGFTILKIQNTPWAKKALAMPECKFEVCVLEGNNVVVTSYSVFGGVWTTRREPIVDFEDTSTIVVRSPTRSWLD